MRLRKQIQAAQGADPGGGGRDNGPVHVETGAGKERADERSHEERSQRPVEHQDDAEESTPQRLLRPVADGIGDELDEQGHQKQRPQPAGAPEGNAEKQRESRIDRDAEHHENGEGEDPFAAGRFQDGLFLERPQMVVDQMDLGAQQEHQGNQQAAEEGDKHPPVVLQEGFGHSSVLIICGFPQI